MNGMGDLQQYVESKEVDDEKKQRINEKVKLLKELL